MKITEIQITPIKAHTGLVAIGSIVLDNSFYLGSIGIHKRLNGNGYRLTYPTKKIGNNNINIYHPINKTVSQKMEMAIIEKTKLILGL